jgi:SAM-dependent methyltransferase
MTMIQDYWTRFWQDKDDPLHFSNDDAFYDSMAGEMLALLGSGRFGAVLELACGNGAFYKRLGFDQARYIGVDFSSAMLSAFRKAHQQHPGIGIGGLLPVLAARSFLMFNPLKTCPGVIQHGTAGLLRPKRRLRFPGRPRDA